MPFADLIDEILDLVGEHARALDCVEEVERARDITARGTSAHKQLSVYHEAVNAGADKPEALRQVVDMLIEETMVGTDIDAKS